MRQRTDVDFILQSEAELLEFFWDAGPDGYFNQLDDSERKRFLDLFDQFLGPVLTFVSFFLCGFIARTWELDEERSRFRDIARAQLVTPPYNLDHGVLEATCNAASRMQLESEITQDSIINEMLSLVGFESDKEFSRRIENDYTLPKESCKFIEEKGVMVPGPDGKPVKGNPRTLVIRVDDTHLDRQTLVSILQEDMRKEKAGYYRIKVSSAGDNTSLLTYEVSTSKLVYMHEAVSGINREIAVLRPRMGPWDNAILLLQQPSRSANQTGKAGERFE